MQFWLMKFYKVGYSNMNKKSFKTSFDDLLGQGRAESTEVKKARKYQETKSTFVVRCDHLDKIKAIAYLERKMIKDILADSLESYIDNYEKANGAVVLPKT
jgi:hypothetical protein